MFIYWVAAKINILVYNILAYKFLCLFYVKICEPTCQNFHVTYSTYSCIFNIVSKKIA